MPISKEPQLPTNKDFEFLKSLPGISMKQRKPETAKTPIAENSIPENVNPNQNQKVLTFRQKVLSPNPNDYELAVKELFARTVGSIYRPIKQNLKKNPEFDEFIDGESETVQLLRKVNLANTANNYSGITETDINKLDQLLHDDDNVESQQIPESIAQKLQRVLTRLRKLDGIKALIENAPHLDNQIKETEKTLVAIKSEAFDAQKVVEEAVKRSESIALGVQTTQSKLAEMIAQRAKVPKNRHVEETTINKEFFDNDNSIDASQIGVAEEITLQNQRELLKVLQEAEFQKLVEAEVKRQEKIDRILVELESKIGRYDIKSIKLIKDFKLQIGKCEESTSLKTTECITNLSGLKKFDDKEMKNEILIKLSIIISNQINKLESKELAKNQISQKVEVLKTGYEKIGCIEFAPCFEVSPLVRKTIQENNPNLQTEISRINSFVQTVNEFYEMQKVKNSNDDNQNYFGSFVLSIINHNNIANFGDKERQDFTDATSKYGFERGWWQTEKKTGNNLIVEGQVIDSRININNGNGSRLYIRNNNGRFELLAGSNSFGHI